MSERYLSWFGDAGARAAIVAAERTRSLDDLRAYVSERMGRDDVLFLGIFDIAGGLHVGNVKYEPVDVASGRATMGILIGDPAFRGRGVAQEVLRASGGWLREHRGIRTIGLCVDANNAAAIAAYQRVGFRAVAPATGVVLSPDGVWMEWTL